MAYVTFIHGVGKQKQCEDLLDTWKDALSENNGLDLDAENIDSSLVNWSDVIYGKSEANEARLESFIDWRSSYC